jgi:hypothetical protein
VQAPQHASVAPFVLARARRLDGVASDATVSDGGGGVGRLVIVASGGAVSLRRQSWMDAVRARMAGRSGGRSA